MVEAENLVSLDAARRGILNASPALRGLAVLAVITIHITAGPMLLRASSDHPRFMVAVVLLNSACRFAVPVFFILSSFSLCLRPIKPGRLWRFYKTKLPKLIIPYLVYSVVYGGLRILDGRWPLSLLGATEGLLLGDIYFHLWFIHVLTLLCVLHPFALSFYRRYLAGTPVAVAVLGGIQVGLIWWIGQNRDLASWHWTLYTILNHPVLRSWWYLFAGYVLFDHADRITAFTRRPVGRCSAGLVALVALGGIVSSYTHYLGPMPVGVRPGNPLGLSVAEPILGAAVLLVLIGSASWTKGHAGAVIKSFGLYSLGVYLVHPALRLAIDRLLIAPVHPLYLFVCFGLLPVTTLILVRLLARSSVGRFLV